jgi:hypothetical protein
MSDLRKALIRLAHENPDLRADLLPLLKTAAGPNPRGNNWTEKQNPTRWVWSGRSGEPAFTVTEHEAPFGSYYKLQILLSDGTMAQTYGQKTNKEHWFRRAADLYKRWASHHLDLSQTPERWSKMAAGFRPPGWDNKPQMAPAPWETGGSSKGPKMGRFTNERAAKAYAREHGLYYGHSALSRGVYVGTLEQLKKIGVVRPQKG